MYDSLIQKRKNTPPPPGYIEEHHILPRSLGGGDSKDNLVKLTAREHFICHLLLTKLYPKGTLEWYKVVRAFLMMCVSSLNQQRYFNSKLYTVLKQHTSAVMSIFQAGTRNSQYGSRWMYNLETEVSKKVPITGLIPTGWALGRRIPSLRKPDNLSSRKEEKLRIKAEARALTIKKYSEWYDLYIENGWEEFVRITGYTKSKPNFVMRCAEYLPEFIPQNGKKRGKRTK